MRSRVRRAACRIDDVSDNDLRRVRGFVAKRFALVLKRQVVLVGCVWAFLGDLQVGDLELGVGRVAADIGQIELEHTLGARVARFVQVGIVSGPRQLQSELDDLPSVGHAAHRERVGPARLDLVRDLQTEAVDFPVLPLDRELTVTVLEHIRRVGHR